MADKDNSSGQAWVFIVPFQLIDLIHPNKVSLVDEQLFLRTSSIALARQYTSKVKREKFVKQDLVKTFELISTSSGFQERESFRELFEDTTKFR